MYSEDDLQYAIENTRVILSPERRIDTFGTTSFKFYLVSEMMDSANEIRVRNGKIEAERPQIISSSTACRTHGRLLCTRWDRRRLSLWINDASILSFHACCFIFAVFWSVT